MDGPAPLAKLLTQRERRKKPGRNKTHAKKQRRQGGVGTADAVDGGQMSQEEEEVNILSG